MIKLILALLIGVGIGYWLGCRLTIQYPDSVTIVERDPSTYGESLNPSVWSSRMTAYSVDEGGIAPVYILPQHTTSDSNDYTDAQIESMDIPPWQKTMMRAMREFGTDAR